MVKRPSHERHEQGQEHEPHQEHRNEATSAPPSRFSAGSAPPLIAPGRYEDGGHEDMLAARLC